MKNNRPAMTWLVLVLAALAFWGCGYSKSQQRKVDAQAQMTTAKSAAEAQKAAAKAAEQEAYSKYRIEMEKINLEREKAGLAPRPIPTLQEWRRLGN